MFVVVGGPLVPLVFYIITLRLAGRRYGWVAVALVTLSMPFWLCAWYTLFFPEVRVLTAPSAFIGMRLAGTGLMFGYNYLPRRAERIAERRQREAEWQWAEETVRSEPPPPRCATVQEDWAAYAQRNAAREAPRSAKRRIEPTFRTSYR